MRGSQPHIPQRQISMHHVSFFDVVKFGLLFLQRWSGCTRLTAPVHRMNPELRHAIVGELGPQCGGYSRWWIGRYARAVPTTSESAPSTQCARSQAPQRARGADIASRGWVLGGRQMVDWAIGRGCYLRPSNCEISALRRNTMTCSGVRACRTGPGAV